jgi:thioredoxin reductase (NADPH)
LVGGGNSAGQGVVYLADIAAHVTLLARRPLEETMSAYLVERIRGLDNVEVVTGVEVSALEGEQGMLEAIRWHATRRRRETRRAVRRAVPVHRRRAQYRLAAGLRPRARREGLRPHRLELHPGRLPLETSRPGVFAVGDVRSGSVKRVAASVGDGAQVVAAIHAYLARLRHEPVAEPEPVIA